MSFEDYHLKDHQLQQNSFAVVASFSLMSTLWLLVWYACVLSPWRALVLQRTCSSSTTLCHCSFSISSHRVFGRLPPNHPAIFSCRRRRVSKSSYLSIILSAGILSTCIPAASTDSIESESIGVLQSFCLPGSTVTGRSRIFFWVLSLPIYWTFSLVRKCSSFTGHRWRLAKLLFYI